MGKWRRLIAISDYEVIHNSTVVYVIQLHEMSELPACEVIEVSNGPD